MTLSPDGKTLAVVESSFENQRVKSYLKLYETETGKEGLKFKRRRMGCLISVTLRTARFSPRLGIRASPSTTRLRERIRHLKINQTQAAALVFAPDGKTLASRGIQDGVIRFWETETGKEVRQLGQSESPVLSNPFLQSLRCADVPRSGLLLGWQGTRHGQQRSHSHLGHCNGQGTDPGQRASRFRYLRPLLC